MRRRELIAGAPALALTACLGPRLMQEGLRPLGDFFGRGRAPTSPFDSVAAPPRGFAPPLLAPRYGIGELTTVSAGPDDGTNNLVASLFEQPRRHSNFGQCAANLNLPDPSCGGTAGSDCDRPEPQNRAIDPREAAWQARDRRVQKNMNICGHGTAGWLDVGAGTGAQNRENVIRTWNAWTWGPSMAAAGRGYDGTITIQSCATGAGFEGAMLVWMLAKATERKVRAFTGLMTIMPNEILLQAGGRWQEASPDMAAPPPPIDAPKPSPALFGLDSKGRFASTVRTRQSAIERARVRVSDDIDYHEAELSADRARWLFDSIAGSHPFHQPGKVPGLITMVVEFFRSDGLPIGVEVRSDAIALYGGGTRAVLVDPGLRRAVLRMLGIRERRG